MTVANARKFINRGLQDSDLRDRLNSASDILELQQILEEENVGFTANQFEEAFYLMLKECQTIEFANQLKEFKTWWNFLAQTF